MGRERKFHINVIVKKKDSETIGMCSAGVCMKLCPLDRLLSGGMVSNSYNVGRARNSNDLKACG